MEEWGVWSMIESLKENKELWELFTKKEEYNPSFTDQYERFPYYLTKYKNNFDPKVSRFLTENGMKIQYPDDSPFAICLTHDIDILYQKKLSTMLDSIRLLMKGQTAEGLKKPLSITSKKMNPRINFKEIMRLEEKYDSKSSFYFLALEPHEQDFNFNIENIHQEMTHIVDSGWEVGLHGGHRSYNDLEDMKYKKQKIESIIGKEIIGYRNHYLRFRVPDTWEMLSKAGFKYDTTFAYADCIGFRNGMCHPFKPFNLETNSEIDILEIPMAIADFTLLDGYMRLDHQKSWQIIKYLIDTVEKYNGAISILWHNTHMQGADIKLYEKILKYCHEKGAWMTSGEELHNWWKGSESDKKR